MNNFISGLLVVVPVEGMHSPCLAYRWLMYSFTLPQQQVPVDTALRPAKAVN